MSGVSSVVQRLEKVGGEAVQPARGGGDFKSSKQFAQMKTLLAKKNQQLSELRAQLRDAAGAAAIHDVDADDEVHGASHK